MNLNREMVKHIKELYPAGCRVQLDSMDDVQAPPRGTCGTVIAVDAIGNIHIAWDNGSSLGIVFGHDCCHKIGG